jgi:uncharacterized membrane protein
MFSGGAAARPIPVTPVDLRLCIDLTVGDRKFMNAAEKSIVVNAPVAEVYERWLCFEALPKFITTLGQVERLDDTHFSFGNGKERRGMVEVVGQIPERRIAWRTIGEGVGLGVVSFEPRSDHTTEITLKLRSAFDPSVSDNNADEYLLNFKKLIEHSPR